MTDQPAPLTDDELAALVDEWQFHGGWQPHRTLVDSLLATVEQAHRERDAALTLPAALEVEAWIYTHDHPDIAYPTGHTYRVIVEAALEAIEAIRRARATTVEASE